MPLGLGLPSIADIPPSTDLSGQTALITGGGSGTGFECARLFLHHRLSTLVISVRSLPQGEAARKALLADPLVAKHNPTILVYHLDMLLPSSVRAFVAQVAQEVPVLDIVILNAGIGLMQWTVSPETKSETVFQVNYMSTAMLAVLLLPSLISSSAKTGRVARLTVIGSIMQFMQTMEKYGPVEGRSIVEHFSDEKSYKGMQRYGDSKLLVNMFVNSLATFVSPDQVIVNNIDPGPVSSNLTTNSAWYIRPLFAAMYSLRSRTMANGAKTYVYGTVMAGRETHGKFLDQNRLDEKTPAWMYSQDGKAFQERLWKETLAVTEELLPGSVQAAGLT